MENEILENGTPATEEVQETVAVTETIEATETTPAAKNSITDVLANVANKGKELIENPKDLLDKIKAVPKKIWIFAGAGLAALIAVIIVLSALSNTYKTPVKAVENLLNSKSISQVLNRAPDFLNGFGEKEAETLINIAKKSDLYKDNIEDIEEAFDEAIEMVEDSIGKNYKVKLKVTDKDKLDKDDVKAFRDQLRMIGKLGGQLDDLDDDIIEDMADETGLSKSQVKKAIKAMESFCKDCKGAKVKKGFELTVEAKITGKELDDPMELEIPVNVYKVDGRWVLDVFSLAGDAMDMMGGIDLDDLMDMAGMMGGMGGSSSLIPGF